jgi:hypothetical protein
VWFERAHEAPVEKAKSRPGRMSIEGASKARKSCTLIAAPFSEKIGAVTPKKITDDYLAKVRLWAANPRVIPLPPGPKIPHFPPQRFRSHAEMNEWKRLLFLRMAEEQAGIDELSDGCVIDVNRELSRRL